MFFLFLNLLASLPSLGFNRIQRINIVECLRDGMLEILEERQLFMHIGIQAIVKGHLVSGVKLINLLGVQETVFQPGNGFLDFVDSFGLRVHLGK